MTVKKFKQTILSSFDIETENKVSKIKFVLDSLGYLHIEFGNSFSLKLDYKDIEKFINAFDLTKVHIEDHTLYSDSRQQGLPFDSLTAKELNKLIDY